MPFDRLVALKQHIEARRRWRRLDVGRGYFERRWKAKSWATPRRLLFIRTRDQATE